MEESKRSERSVAWMVGGRQGGERKRSKRGLEEERKTGGGNIRHNRSKGAYDGKGREGKGEERGK